jgi:tetratricopeptide (TPR) repeat protein
MKLIKHKELHLIRIKKTDGVYSKEYLNNLTKKHAENSRNFANVLYTVGRWNDAETIFRSIIHKKDNAEIPLIIESEIAFCKQSLANLLIDKSEYKEARMLFREAGKVFNKLGLKKEFSNIIGNIGTIFFKQGDYNKAFRYYQDQLKRCRNLHDKKGEIIGLGNIGIIYRLRREPDKAMEYYRESLKLSIEIDYKHGIARAYGNLGLVYKSEGDIKNAMNYYQKSLDEFYHIGDKKGIAINLNNLGNFYSDLGKYDEALKSYKDMLKITQEIGYVLGNAYAYQNIGTTYSEIGNFVLADKYLKQGLRISERIDDKAGISSSMEYIALNYLRSKDYDKAIEYFDKTIEICKVDNNLRFSLSYYYNYKANAILKKHRLNLKKDALNFQNLLNLTKESLKLAKDMESPDDIFNATLLINILEAIKGVDKAIIRLEKLIDETTDRNKLIKIYYELALLTGKDNYRKEAVKLLKKAEEDRPIIDNRQKMEELDNAFRITKNEN